MANRIYIVPAAPGPAPNTLVPKYIFALNVNMSPIYYGANPTFLVGADLTTAQDTAVIANADVFAFPFNLQATIAGGAVNARKAALEAAPRLIPGDGVVAGMTEQACARYVAGLFQFVQRLQGVLGNEVFIDTSAKLNVLWNTIPAVPYQNAILEAAASLNYSTTFITGTTQLRVILRNFSEQWGNESFNLGNGFII
jgi:hypothetical protein